MRLINKIFLFLFILLIASGQIFGQDSLYNKGAYIKIAEGTLLIIEGSNGDLVNDNSGTLNIDGTLTIEGDFYNDNSSTVEIEDGGVMTAGQEVNNDNSASIEIDGTLNIQGNWINNAIASLVYGDGTYEGTVEFQGGSAQTIGGTTGTIFEGLSINNSNGVSLTDGINQTVSQQLSFSDGIITTGANYLILNATDDGVSGTGTGKYVVGNIRRYVSIGVDYTIPIGTAANYEEAGIRVSSMTGLNYVDVIFTISDQNPVPGGLTVNGVTIDDFLDYGYWTFTPDAVPAAVNYNVTIQSIGHNNLGGTQDNYSLISDITGSWEDYGVHSSTTQEVGATYVKAVRTGLTSFGNGKYIIGKSDNKLYTPSPISENLQNLGAYFKVADGTTVLADVSTTDVHNDNSGTLNIDGTLTVEGDFYNDNSSTVEIEDGGVMTAGQEVNNDNSATIKIDGTLNIHGNWINNSTSGLVYGDGTYEGTVEFQGSSAQTMGGTTGTSFEELSINNSNGVSLTDGINQTVSQQLSFSDGIITTGANYLILNASDNGVSGTGTGKYVVGNIRRYVST